MEKKNRAAERQTTANEEPAGYTICFFLKAVAVEASATKTLAEIVGDSLAALAERIAATAEAMPTDASTHQELPKMAELNLAYDDTPFAAIRLLGVREQNGRLVTA